MTPTERIFFRFVRSGKFSVLKEGFVVNNETGTLMRGNAKGYPRASFYDGKKVRSVSVHRVVFLTYKGDIPRGCIIHHKDDDRSNARVSNLQLVTHRQNCNFAISSGRCKRLLGEKNPFSKLKDREVLLVRHRYMFEEESIKKLADEYKVTRATISAVLKGKTYGHLPGVVTHIRKSNFLHRFPSREDLFSQIKLLNEKGKSDYAIAKILKISRPTVQRIRSNLGLGPVLLCSSRN